MKKAMRFIKRNFIACLCFTLAAAVAVSGSFSFARYVSGGGENPSGVAGSFAYSSSIDAVSALSFTNTAFWGGAVGGSDDEKIAMNALRAIEFSVSNFKDPANNPSEVALGYTLTFMAPANFIEKLAIQLFDEDADTPMLPQIVMQDLLGTPSGSSFNTADSESYNSTAAADLTFAVQKAGNLITATSGDVRIKIEADTANLRQALLFRLWDTSALGINPVTDESGLLLPPIEAKLNIDVPIYRISISMNALRLAPGAALTRHHSLRFAPTNTLNDDYLGGSIYAADGTDLKSFGAGGNYLLRTVKEQITDNDVAQPMYTVIGKPTVYTLGETKTTEGVEGAYTETLSAIREHTKSDTLTYGEVYDALGWPTPGETHYYNSDWSAAQESDTTGVFNSGTYYRLTVNATSTVTVTETARIAAGATVQVMTNTYETYTPTSVSTTAIDLNVVRTTEKIAAYNGTVTIQRVYTLSEYTLQKKSGMFSSWSSTSDAFGGVANFPTATVTESATAYGPVTLTPDTVNITRHIARTIQEVSFSPDSVSRTDDDENTYEYTNSSPLALISGDTQIFYISQCYSKSYPFKMDITFEQVFE